MTEDEKRERFEALYREHFRAMYLAASRALTARGGAEADAASR